MACAPHQPGPTRVAPPTIQDADDRVPRDRECIERARLGSLEICGASYEAPSHGGTEAIEDAYYKLENVGSAPETVAIVALDVVADPDRCAESLPPDGQRRAMTITHVRSTRASANRIVTVEPGARVEVKLVGNPVVDDFLYHVRYHHEARFRVAGEEVVVRAGDLYFRYPHR